MVDRRRSRKKLSPNAFVSMIIDGKDFDGNNLHFRAGDILEASTDFEIYLKYGGIHIFRTLLTDYPFDHDLAAITDRKGEVTDLGELESVVSDEDEILQLVQLKPESLYDIMFPFDTNIELYRISTGDEPVPERLTLDERKLQLAVRLGVHPRDLQGIQATVVANTVEMRNSYDLAYYGFQVGDLVASIIDDDWWEMNLVDTKDFWREVKEEEFLEYILKFKQRGSN